jgi:hypothetical protein
MTCDGFISSTEKIMLVNNKALDGAMLGLNDKLETDEIAYTTNT